MHCINSRYDLEFPVRPFIQFPAVQIAQIGRMLLEDQFIYIGDDRAAAPEIRMSQKIRFHIDAFRRDCLLNGLDDIGLTMQKVEKIDAFEATQRQQQPWLYS